jgi:sentrin-specific protease 7
VKDIAYNRVKKWTKTVDIFSKDYWIIPIIDYEHWNVAIVQHPGKLFKQYSTMDSNQIP